jgi:hypothetical protein
MLKRMNVPSKSHKGFSIPVSGYLTVSVLNPSDMWDLELIYSRR